jgi:hypothetical protein
VDCLEAATTRAIKIGTLTDRSVRSIPDNKFDRQATRQPPLNGVPIFDLNTRGPLRRPSPPPFSTYSRLVAEIRSNALERE